MSDVRGLNLSQILAIIKVLREIDFKVILDFPDLENSADLRKWVEAVLEALDLLADYTGTDFDDNLIEQALIAVRNDDTWNTLYLVVDFVMGFFKEEDPAVNYVADKTDCDPTVVLLIVSAVISALRLIQEWRKQRS
jgi:hypothetical protein